MNESPRSPAAAGEGTPAGVPVGDPVGQQAVGVVVESERDRRALAWLRQTVGDVAIADAVGRLSGSRRAYVSNLAKVLGLTLPPDRADRQTAADHLAAMRATLRGR